MKPRVVTVSIEVRTPMAVKDFRAAVEGKMREMENIELLQVGRPNVIKDTKK